MFDSKLMTVLWLKQTHQRHGHPCMKTVCLVPLTRPVSNTFGVHVCKAFPMDPLLHDVHYPALRCVYGTPTTATAEVPQSAPPHTVWHQPLESVRMQLLKSDMFATRANLAYNRICNNNLRLTPLVFQPVPKVTAQPCDHIVPINTLLFQAHLLCLHCYWSHSQVLLVLTSTQAQVTMIEVLHVSLRFMICKEIKHKSQEKLQ